LKDKRLPPGSFFKLKHHKYPLLTFWRIKGIMFLIMCSKEETMEAVRKSGNTAIKRKKSDRTTDGFHAGSYINGCEKRNNLSFCYGK